MLPLCRELGIGFVAYSPLGRGFLTGQIRSRDDLPEGDFRRRDPRYDDGNFEKNLEIVAVVEKVAARRGVSPAQVALAWLLAQGQEVVPIPGCKRRATLVDSIAAAGLALAGEDLAELDAARAVAGPRYRPEAMRMVRL